MDLTTRPSSLTLTRAGTAAPKKQSPGLGRLWSGKDKQKQGKNMGFFYFCFFFFGYRKEILLPNRKEYVIFPPKCAQC